jgi:L-ascorbate metabolism protein UlaG (beta-lactamase superfamily)
MEIFLTITLSLISAIVFMMIVIFLVNLTYASKGYKWDISDHFDGKRFYNIGWSPRESYRIERSEDKKWGLIYWLLHREKNKWKERKITQIKPKERNTSDEVVMTYIGHATVLIQIAGINILTDPVWSPRASPWPWLGPKRYTGVWVKLEDLPQIDIILLSHNHYDHMDIWALKKLESRDHPTIYTGLGNKKYLEDRRIMDVVEMDWWESIDYSKKEIGDGWAQSISTPIPYLLPTRISFLPAQHFSARGLTDRNKTLWWGFRVEIGSKSLYFAWDTWYGSFVEKIREKYPEGFDYGLIPIWAYKPRWFMAPVHTDPFEGMLIQRDLGIRKSIGIHFGTFDLADDNQDEPLEDLKKAKEDPKYKNQIFEIGPSGSVWNW